MAFCISGKSTAGCFVRIVSSPASGQCITGVPIHATSTSSPNWKRWVGRRRVHPPSSLVVHRATQQRESVLGMGGILARGFLFVLSVGRFATATSRSGDLASVRRVLGRRTHVCFDSS